MTMRTTALVATTVAIVCAVPCFAQKVNLKQTQFEDGTGSIGLAPGWQLTGAYRGSPQCQGPDGSVVILGVPWAMIRPDSSLTSLPAAAQSPIAQPNDLVGALREVLAKKAQATLKSVRMRPAPSANPGAPAAYFLYEYVQNGRTYVALGYFTALDYGPGNPWQLYSSAVTAPKEKFTKMLPTMMAMWKSWRPNGQAPLAGSESAKIDEIIKDRSERMDEIQKQFRKLL
jgi:hypothetical protein